MQIRGLGFIKGSCSFRLLGCLGVFGARVLSAGFGFSGL